MSLKIHPGKYYVYPEDDMPESQAQIDLGKYLTAVLEYLYRMQPYFITGNLTIVPPNETYPFTQIVPDVMVIEGVSFSEEERVELNSWNMKQPNRPAPMTVFEVSSENTWSNDLNPKPEHYRRLGVREYFAFDPQRHWPGSARLRGWRYSNGQTQEIVPNPGQTRLWSETLESWVEPAGARLHLTDREGNLRLTGEEAERQAREIARQQAETERQAREVARQQAEVERQAKEQALQAAARAQQQIEAERQRAETEKAALQELLEKLRRHNIDPDAL